MDGRKEAKDVKDGSTGIEGRKEKRKDGWMEGSAESEGRKDERK